MFLPEGFQMKVFGKLNENYVFIACPLPTQFGIRSITPKLTRLKKTDYVKLSYNKDNKNQQMFIVCQNLVH